MICKFKIANALFIVSGWFFLPLCIAQDEPGFNVTPERMGFAERRVKLREHEVRYYLSTEGKPFDGAKQLPLVLFLDGSGPNPLFWGDRKRMGSSLMFDSRDFPGFHYAVISKPGVQFHEAQRRIKSEVYDALLSLRWRVDVANAVLNDLAKEKSVDSSKILVVGHSEGADVAPWVAMENESVTHVAGLAPGGASQMFDFILFVRKKVSAGELSQEQGDKQVAEIKAAYLNIFADPTSTTRKWKGETHLRWSSFFRPGNEAWVQIDKPIYLAICRDDQNTPVECGEAIELEFIRLGKANLTSKVWPCDHYFAEATNAEVSASNDRRSDVIREILEWVQSN